MNEAKQAFDWMKLWRVTFAIAGVALVLVGASQLFTKVPIMNLVWLGVWLVAALLIHDGILAPAVVVVGAAVRRLIPDRARRYVQVGLIMAGLVSVIAVILVARRGTQPPAKAMLLQDYILNWGLLVGVLGAVAVITYAIRVARDRRE